MLLYRQTAPLRWPRGVHVLHRSDPTSPNYARLDARTIDELVRVRVGLAKA